MKNYIALNVIRMEKMYPKIYIFDETLVVSIIWSKFGNRNDRIFKEEEGKRKHRFKLYFKKNRWSKKLFHLRSRTLI